MHVGQAAPNARSVHPYKKKIARENAFTRGTEFEDVKKIPRITILEIKKF